MSIVASPRRQTSVEATFASPRLAVEIEPPKNADLVEFEGHARELAKALEAAAWQRF